MGRLRFLALTKTQEAKQMQIDAMGIQSYQVDGLEQVRFHDVLSACVQRVYKNSNPVTAFRIDDQDKENDNQDGKKSKDRKSPCRVSLSRLCTICSHSQLPRPSV